MPDAARWKRALPFPARDPRCIPIGSTSIQFPVIVPAMPQQPTKYMLPQEKRAYDEAVRRIETCRLKGKNTSLYRPSGDTLDLSAIGLTLLPPEIGQLIHLHKLLLAENQLTTLPDIIGDLTQLEELYLSRNPLTELPDSLWRLEWLRILKLRGNSMMALPYEIALLRNLRVLDLAGNSLSEIPDWLCNLTQLKVLDVSFNPIVKLPD